MTETPLPPWERPFFEPGGGDPFLFYAVFGPFSDEEWVLPRPTYRPNGAPAGVEVVRHGRAEQPDWFASFFAGHLGRLLDDQLGEEGRSVRAAPACITLVGSVADPPTLDYLRDVVGLVAFLLDRGGVAVLDAFALHWWTPEAWRRDLFTPGEPVPLRHVDILVSEDEPAEGRPAVRVHTRGLRKFGRPDLSVRGVTEAQLSPVMDLFNRFIVLQALGGVLPEGQPVRMEGLPDGLSCRHAGSTDDPDFNNVHVAIGRARPGGAPFRL
jgi:hypothetical protein